MTDTAKMRSNNVRNWAALGVSVVNLFALVWMAAWWGRGMEANDDKLSTLIESNQKALAQHDKADKHMAFERKVEIFITRKEFETLMNTRDSQINRLQETLAKDIKENADTLHEIETMLRNRGT